MRPCPGHGSGQPTSSERRATEPGKRLYDQQRWRKASRRFLVAHPLCIDCEAAGLIQLSAHVDHEVPHKGNVALFWDETNWRARCATCHGRKTQREVMR